MQTNTYLIHKKRCYGLDLLRIVSMFMIVVTHVLGKGGLRSAVDIGSVDAYFIITWIIQVLMYGAVNCYALISGYVGISSKYRYSKLVNIWVQVFFYSFLITLLFWIFGFKITLNNWRQAFFPIVSGAYWYITAYFGLLIFMPLINAGINSLSDKQLKRLVLLIFVVFSVAPALMNQRVAEFSLSKGFEMTWLIILYIVGAYLQRLDLTRFKSIYLVLTFFISLAVTYIMKFAVGNIWYWYVSPSLSIGALALFILFAKMNIQAKSAAAHFITWIAPATLGIYLVHLHPLIVKFVIKDFAEPLLNTPLFIYPIFIFDAAFAIYLIAFVIEKLRRRLFKKLRFSAFLNRIDRKIPFAE